MFNKNIIVIVIIAVLIIVAIYFLTKKKFKILPSSTDVLHVKYGKEYGVLEITPTQELVLESQGIRFIGINRENKTIGVLSLATGKEAKINYQNKTIA